ncbi:prepilin-type N-terminal cleavage/methylation domain-containing protein [Pseudidiomarina andamanensis]|uniref:Prepilin-type N-terminal cleavage/methylation domain-containing protein n=2 Tax=Pseudidiomarina andamanensis TaxID=1940690 RepID=A0AA92EUP4_9GAMM|nr:prepilin-type N-terminal cleavage/methylation domain-containing protein [Pseudidiomarina andamanensis]
MPRTSMLRTSITQRPMNSSQRGFTLIEIIIGIVVLGISIVLLTVLIFPQAQRSAEPMLQQRAAALGEAFIQEISGKSFDENSDRSGGLLRCGEAAASACTAPTNLGPDAETREDFDDVDDYHLLETTAPTLADAMGDDIASRYPGFSFAISVCYSDSTGTCQSTITLYKRIEVTITTSFGQNFTFATLRGNY